MKEAILAPTLLPGDVSSAIRRALGDAVLRCVHGPNMTVTPWSPAGSRAARRTVSFSMAVEKVPRPVRRFFCGDRMRVTSRQHLTRSPGVATVRHELELHFVGARFFRVQPVFTLRKVGDDATTLEARVQNHARFPPPLNGIAERFMAANSQRELDALRDCVLRVYAGDATTGDDLRPGALSGLDAPVAQDDQ